MATVAIPIKERILRQLLATVEAVAMLGTARRWDARGTTNAQSDQCTINVSSETVEDVGVGNPPSKQCTMNVGCGVLLLPREDGTLASDSLVNRRQMQIETALLSNLTIVETGSNVRLAVWSEVIDRDAPVLEGGVVNCSVTLRAVYRHDGDNPAAYGTAIAQTTETYTEGGTDDA